MIDYGISRTRTGRYARALMALTIALGLAAGPALAAGVERGPGYVDSTVFSEIAGGEETVRVQINLSGSLLKVIISGLPEDLRAVFGGLEAIHAIILELGSSQVRERAAKTIDATSKDLQRKGWSLVAKVKEDGESVNVLVLDDGDMIRGLVVLVVDLDGGEMVFANVAGSLDPKVLAKLAELDIPGLEALGEME